MTSTEHQPQDTRPRLLTSIAALRDDRIQAQRDELVALALDAGIHWRTVAAAYGTTRKATVYESLRRHRQRQETT